MQTQAVVTNEAADVLAVLRRAQVQLDRGHIGSMNLAIEVGAARAAVIELILAGRELQAAMGENEATSKFDTGPANRFHAADARHRAALARCGGAA